MHAAIRAPALQLQVAERLVCRQHGAVRSPVGLGHVQGADLPACAPHYDRQRDAVHAQVPGQLHKAALGVVLPIPVGRQIAEGPEARLALAQLVLHTHVVAHVGKGAHQAAIGQRGGAHLERAAIARGAPVEGRGRGHCALGHVVVPAPVHQAVALAEVAALGLHTREVGQRGARGHQ